VEISRAEGWARKIQIRDRDVTRAIFIENSNKCVARGVEKRTIFVASVRTLRTIKREEFFLRLDNFDTKSQ
jgi:hypothetical protein